MTQAEVVSRLAEVEFSVTDSSGATSLLPVTVKGAEAIVNSAVVQAFAGRRGQIRKTGPARYGVLLDPSLYSVGTWFKIRWYIVHPTGNEGFLDVDYFFRRADDSLPVTENVYPEKTVSEVGNSDEWRHLIATEIMRRAGLLLRRFNGSFCAFLLRHNRGVRCPECYEVETGRRLRSQCFTCYGTGFKGGYSKPIYGWVYHNTPAKVIQLSPLGEQKQQNTPEMSWTIAHPPLNPGDIYVLQNGERWRIVPPVQNTKMEGHLGAQPVRQIFPAQRVNPDDPVMQVKVPDLTRPIDTFVGFMKGDRRVANGVTFNASGIL